MCPARCSRCPSISTRPAASPSRQLAARARRLKRQRGLGLLVVDYLQLLAGSRKRAPKSRVQEVTEITLGLKALAKELNVPILALSQLSRQVENRDDKRPQLADLRESGSIEQDADVVLFVYREEYYLAREPRPGTQDISPGRSRWTRCTGVAEVIIGKQRHGPTGTSSCSSTPRSPNSRTWLKRIICRSSSSKDKSPLPAGERVNALTAQPNWPSSHHGKWSYRPIRFAGIVRPRKFEAPSCVHPMPISCSPARSSPPPAMARPSFSPIISGHSAAVRSKQAPRWLAPCWERSSACRWSAGLPSGSGPRAWRQPAPSRWRWAISSSLSSRN